MARVGSAFITLLCFTSAVLLFTAHIVATTLFVTGQMQARRDRQRRRFILSFPADLPKDQVLAWLHTITPGRGGGWSRFEPLPTRAFEVLATPAGIVHRLSVPISQAEQLPALLRALVPGINVSPDTGVATGQDWTCAVELGLTRPTNPLRIFHPEVLATSLLVPMEDLRDGERLLWQLVIAPAARSASVGTSGRPPRARGLLGLIGVTTGQPHGGNNEAKHRARCRTWGRSHYRITGNVKESLRHQRIFDFTAISFIIQQGHLQIHISRSLRATES